MSKQHSWVKEGRLGKIQDFKCIKCDKVWSISEGHYSTTGYMYDSKYEYERVSSYSILLKAIADNICVISDNDFKMKELLK